MSKEKVTLEDIKSAQQTWKSMVIDRNIDGLMSLYAHSAVLKPTLSDKIRTTPEDIKLYFVGGEKYSDNGFLNNEIDEIRFHERNPFEQNNLGYDMGIYEFLAQGKPLAKAHFSFIYKKIDGKTKILLQHSSF